MDDLRVMKTRESIQNALIALSQEKEISAVTVSDIAKKARISRSTFYDHYHNTADCLNDIVKETLQELENRLKKRGTVTREVYMQEVFALVKKDPEKFLVLGHGRPDGAFIQGMQKLFEKYAGTTNAYRRKVEDKYWAYYRIYGTVGIVTAWIQEGCQTPIEDLLEAMFDDQLLKS